MTERDLSFLDVDTPSPKVLTQEQISDYNTKGYLKPFTAYDAEGATQQREYFDDLLARMQEAHSNHDTYSINGFQIACRGLYDIVTNPLILDCVQDLVGPDVMAWGTHYFCKNPHDPQRVAWHQDASYWPLSPARTVTVWLAIDDADAGNAAMQFIPGTHRMGHLKWDEAEGAAVLNQEISDISQYGESVYDDLKAGQFSLHADMLAHGSDPNPSDRRRCGLTIRYCPPSVVPQAPGWGDRAILCRGSAEGTNWKFPPKPESDEIPPWAKPIGGN